LFLASDGRQKKVHWLMRRCEEFASRSVMLCCTQMLYTGAVIKSSQQQGELLCCSINCQSQASWASVSCRVTDTCEQIWHGGEGLQKKTWLCLRGDASAWFTLWHKGISSSCWVLWVLQGVEQGCQWRGDFSSVLIRSLGPCAFGPNGGWYTSGGDGYCHSQEEGAQWKKWSFHQILRMMFSWAYDKWISLASFYCIDDAVCQFVVLTSSLTETRAPCLVAKSLGWGYCEFWLMLCSCVPFWAI